jgi:hypothetical protein
MATAEVAISFIYSFIYSLNFLFIKASLYNRNRRKSWIMRDLLAISSLEGTVGVVKWITDPDGTKAGC